MKTFLRVAALSLVGAIGLGLSIQSYAQTPDLLDRIKAKKEIVIATEARYAPFEFIENGKIVGYNADLMRVVMTQLPDVNVRQLDLPFQGLLPGLDTKAFDIVVTAITINKERASHFSFTSPVAISMTGLLVKERDSALNAIADLNNKTVGSQSGSVQLQALIALDKQLKDSGTPGFKAIKQYVSFDEAYADLASGRLDAVAQSIANLGPLLKSRPGLFKVLPGSIGEQSYFAWAARKDADSETLVKLFNDGIARAAANGTLTQLQTKWFGTTMDIPASVTP